MFLKCNWKPEHLQYLVIKSNRIQLAVFLIGLLSLVFYSWQYYQAVESPLLDSDQSIWVIMTRSPHFPDAFYFYGQNRLGSLLPLLAHGLVLVGLPAIWAIAVMNLLFQVAAAALYFRISKSAAAAIAIACLFLLPPWTMYVLNLIGHPYTSQLLLWLLFGLRMQYLRPGQLSDLLQVVLLLLLSLWVSDLSVIMLPIAFVWAIWGKHIRNRRHILIALFSFSIGFVLLMLLKNQLPGPRGYFLKFISFEELQINLSGLQGLFAYYYHLSGLSRALLIVSGLLFIASFFLGRPTAFSRACLTYGLLALLLTLASKWVALNSGETRYFAWPFALLFMAVLSREYKKLHPSFYYLPTLLLAGGYATKHIHPGFRPTPDRPSRLEMALLSKEIEKGAVLSDYWSCYLLAAENPDIVSTQEHLPVRDPWQRNFVLTADSLYLVNVNKPAIWNWGGKEYVADGPSDQIQ